MVKELSDREPSESAEENEQRLTPLELRPASRISVRRFAFDSSESPERTARFDAASETLPLRPETGQNRSNGDSVTCDISDLASNDGDVVVPRADAELPATRKSTKQRLRTSVSPATRTVSPEKQMTSTPAGKSQASEDSNLKIGLKPLASPKPSTSYTPTSSTRGGARRRRRAPSGDHTPANYWSKRRKHYVPPKRSRNSRSKARQPRAGHSGPPRVELRRQVESAIRRVFDSLRIYRGHSGTSDRKANQGGASASAASSAASAAAKPGVLAVAGNSPRPTVRIRMATYSHVNGQLVEPDLPSLPPNTVGIRLRIEIPLRHRGRHVFLGLWIDFEF
ncbi:hypothetical protein BIW11_01299 [Tropilaelaps mercedesae]|uniref:Uncharacterized protein n=1 Tax=Tropilaelaps mercedesae TaxID=418985 RepID=A0A1V9XG03_9ACAR|nr:hypothetical protein BIW11_01299 [Tropilaelaps mercedesae]